MIIYMNSIVIDKFKKDNPYFSLLIGIPAFGGNLKAGFTQSILKLQMLFFQIGLPHDFNFMEGESLICRGRNAIVSNFLSTNHSHLLFLDADLVFNPTAIIHMIIQDLDIVGLSYPKKGINWDKASYLINEKKPIRGRLCDMNFNPYLVDGNAITKGRYMRAKDIPTGAMLINKNVFYALMRVNPHLRYRNNVSGYNGHLLYDFFEVGKCPNTGFYLSEDFFFCKKCTDLGYELWIDYLTPLGHIGSFEFQGSIKAELDDQLIQFNKDLVEVNLDR